MNLDGLEHIVFFSSAEHIVISHAPGVELVRTFSQSVAEVASCKHLGDLFVFETSADNGTLKVAYTVEILFFLNLLLSLSCFNLGALGERFFLDIIWLLDLQCLRLLLCFSQLRLVLLLGLFSPVLPVKVSNATLALIIPSPAIDFARCSQSDGVVLTTFDLNHVLFLQVVNSRGPACIVFVANPELAVVVESPSEQLPFIVNIE